MKNLMRKAKKNDSTGLFCFFASSISPFYAVVSCVLRRHGVGWVLSGI
jgi:hypothetical protein